MNQMNERDLEQVAGGHMPLKPREKFDSEKWKRENCEQCAKNDTCEAKKIFLYDAKTAWAEGKKFACKFKQ